MQQLSFHVIAAVVGLTARLHSQSYIEIQADIMSNNLEKDLSVLEVNIIVTILFHLIYHILIAGKRKNCGRRSGRPGAAGRPAAKAVG